MAALDPLSLPVVGAGVILVLLACSAFFSSSEIAIFSVERYRVGVLAEGGGDGAVLEALRSDPHRLLVTILVGNNVVNIAMSSVATAILVAALPAGVAVTVSTVLLTVVVLVFGEIVPKSYGVANAESWALRTAPTVRRFQRVAGPVVTAFDLVTRRLSTVVGGEPAIEAPYVTRDELAALVRSAERGGEIDADERDMVESVLGLHEITAGDVMVPRENVVAVDAAVSIREAATLAADSPTDAGTLAGYVYRWLGRVPRSGERVDLDGIAVTIEQIDGERIRRMFVESEGVPVDDDDAAS